MWLLRVLNPLKLLYALATAAVVAVVLSMALILMWDQGLSDWARVAVVIGLPLFSFLLWRQDRDTLCPTCTTTAKPFASRCHKCAAWLPYSTTAQQRVTPAPTVSWNRGQLS